MACATLPVHSYDHHHYGPLMGRLRFSNIRFCKSRNRLDRTRSKTFTLAAQSGPLGRRLRPSRAPARARPPCFEQGSPRPPGWAGSPHPPGQATSPRGPGTPPPADRPGTTERRPHGGSPRDRRGVRPTDAIRCPGRSRPWPGEVGSLPQPTRSACPSGADGALMGRAEIRAWRATTTASRWPRARSVHPRGRSVSVRLEPLTAWSRPFTVRLLLAAEPQVSRTTAPR